MRFAVVGLGGVGGTLGALLAHGGADVAFIARGEHLAAIRKDGLALESGFGNFTVRPRIATDDASEVGVVDCVLVCTKGYGLPGAVKSMAPMIGDDTLVISTLNGVGNAQRLRELGCGGIIADGCIYIFAQRKAPGRIWHKGHRCRLMFGGAFDGAAVARMEQAAEEMRACGMQGGYVEDIAPILWHKFAMINSMGMAQSYYRANYGEMSADPAKMADMRALIDETARVARAAGVNIPDDMERSVVDDIATFAPEATTSLQRDLAAGHESELSQYGPYVLSRARELGVSVPVTERITAALS